MTLEQAAWIAALASTPVAVVSTVVAVVSRRDAKRSARAAENLAAIEQRRLHDELTPQLSITCQGPGSDRVRVTVKLDGPAGLDRLDQFEVRVRDDKDRSPVTAGGPTQEQIAATIWGPYRFVPNVDGADRLGRAVPGFPLDRGTSRSLEMEPAPLPPWVSTPEWWRREYADQPIRLDVTCVQDGERPWQVPIELDQPQPRMAIEAQLGHAPVRVVARNVGTAPARNVSFRPLSNGSTVAVRGEEEAVLNVGDSISASVLLTDKSVGSGARVSWCGPTTSG